MRWLRTIATILLLLSLGLFTRTANAQFQELARQVPASANAIAFVNVEKLMESPIAKRDGWAEKRDAAYGAGLTMLPPEGKFAIMTSHMDLDVWVPLWEAAVLQLDHEPSMPKVAGMTGGKLDKVADHEAVALPSDAYVVRTGEKLVAFMAPANRQTVARWMREISLRKEPGLSPYLTEAYRFANQIGTPVILALDLEDALPEGSIKEALEQPGAKEFLSKNKLDPSAVLAMLSGIRGITLGVTFSDKPFGKIKVDFRNDVVFTPEQAKIALLHALSEHGAMIDELTEWKPAVSSKQLTLEGYLTKSGTRRLSSLFDRPPSMKGSEASPSQSQSENQPKSQSVAQSSQNYFNQIGELLEDLSHERKKNSSYTMAQIGVWMDKYAKKIDQLSSLNVDPEMVEYAANVANSLRAGYSAIRTGAARSRVRQVNTQMQYNTYTYGDTYGYTYRAGLFGAGAVPYGYAGYVNVPNTLAYQHERTKVKAEERVNSAQSARDIMAQIDQGTADIRRKMTQKYQVNF